MNPHLKNGCLIAGCLLTRSILDLLAPKFTHRAHHTLGHIGTSLVPIRPGPIGSPSFGRA